MTNAPRQYRPSRLLLAFVAVLASSSVADAQRPVVWVHGIASNGGTWQGTPGWMSQYRHITSQTPSLSSFTFYQSQASEMLSMVGPMPSDMVAIGHSNGGIVSRMAAREHAMRGVVTIGTPHHGALLTTNSLDGDTREWAFNWAYAIVRPLVQYSLYWILDDWCSWWCEPFYQTFANIYDGIVYTLEQLNFIAAPPLRGTTVLGQMEPGSSFRDTLNGGSALSAESANLPERWAIRSEADPNLVSLFVGIFPDNASHFTNKVYIAFGAYTALYEYYSQFTGDDDPDYWAKQANAWMWAEGATALFNTDRAWCTLIGGFNESGGYCSSDGIVPLESQTWPGANNIRTVWGGPGHMRETTNPGVQLFLLEALRAPGFGISDPPPPEQSPYPPSPQINGPYEARPYGSCNWNASVSNGTPPYTFTWRADGQHIGSDESVGYSNPGYTFMLQVTVVDAVGREGSAAIYVNVDWNANDCWSNLH
jgi:pimeloyl-ACP methyl ester carboxylesterase